jgi:hypothetical protein
MNLHTRPDMTEKETRPERRSLQMQIEIPNPGIGRLLSLEEEDLRRHDEECQKLDPEKYDTEYSLLLHNQNVAEGLRMLGEERGADDIDLALLYIAGLGHDLGKLAPCCIIYRCPRKLTAEEMKVMARHSFLSEEHMQKYRKWLRKEDLHILHDACILDRHHHDPYRIGPPRLRRFGWDLMAIDMLVALKETRGNRAGLSLQNAIRMLPREIKRKVPLHWRITYASEIVDTLQMIGKVYLKPVTAT